MNIKYEYQPLKLEIMYKYEEQKQKLFTEEGQIMFLKIRDNIYKLLSTAGAVSMGCAIRRVSGDSWDMLACVDRLIELGEILEIKQKGVAGQYRIFVNSK